ncbi:alanine racemase [Rhodocyclaceae bacterium SMB388]
MARQARIIVCVDDAASVAELSAAARRHGVTLEVLVEIDCGAGRCGVPCGQAVVDLARAVVSADGLVFSGIQAYQGGAQHLVSFTERKARIDEAIRQVSETLELLRGDGIDCEIVGGAGTGSFELEGRSGVYNELQCGSYAFMDADYQRLRDRSGAVVHHFDNALFILTSVMSHAETDKAIVDAGLKLQSVDSGLPTIFGRSDVDYVKCTDEHGEFRDPAGVLEFGGHPGWRCSSSSAHSRSAGGSAPLADSMSEKTSLAYTRSTVVEDQAFKFRGSPQRAPEPSPRCASLSS